LRITPQTTRDSRNTKLVALPPSVGVKPDDGSSDDDEPESDEPPTA
jgi:hypothetical protein